MISTALPYVFHDAIILDLQQETINRFSLTVQLYEIYYPAKETIKLTYSGVYNRESLDRFIAELTTINNEEGIYGLRVNTIQYDEKQVSKENDLFFFIDIDCCEPLKVHCKKITWIREKMMTIDEILKQKESFWQIYETDCIAGCCGIDAFDFSKRNSKLILKEFDKSATLKHLNDLVNATYRNKEEIIISDFFNAKMEKIKFIQIFENLIKIIKTI